MVQIIAFNPQTETIEAEFEVPADLVPEVRRIAHVPACDQQLLGSYLFERSQLPTISTIVGFAVLPGDCDYFLETAEQELNQH